LGTTAAACTSAALARQLARPGDRGPMPDWEFSAPADTGFHLRPPARRFSATLGGSFFGS